MLAALALLLAPVSDGADEAHYLDASLDLDGELLSWRFLDLEGDGAKELLLAMGTAGGERELRVHRLDERGLRREAQRTVPILPDVLAWSAADVRAEPGLELLFLARSGAWSYSLAHPGYRDNVRRLASEELIYDMPDPRALPYWAYVFGGDGRDLVLLPGRERLSVWGPAPAERAGAHLAYELRASLPTDPVDALPGDLDDGGSSRGDGPRVRIDESSPFLPEALDGGASVLEDAYGATAPALLDVDGDGYVDLVDAGEESLTWYRSGSGGPPSAPTRVEDLPEALTDTDERDVHLRLREVDGDGRLDLVAVVADSRDGFENRLHRVLVYRGREEGLLRDDPDQVLRFEAGDLGIRVVDVDGDGRMDLVVSLLELPSLAATVTGIEFTFSFLVFLGEERGFARKPGLSYEETFDEESAIEIAANREWVLDCNGDGTADLVEVDLKGDITIRRVLRSKSRLRGSRWTLEPTPWKHFEVEGSIESLTVADVNGDGLGDVVSAGEDRLTVLLSVRPGGRR